MAVLHPISPPRLLPCRKFNQGEHMARCSLMLEEPKKAKGRGKGGVKAQGAAVDEDDVDIGALEEGEAPPVQVSEEGGGGGREGGAAGAGEEGGGKWALSLGGEGFSRGTDASAMTPHLCPTLSLRRRVRRRRTTQRMPMCCARSWLSKCVYKGEGGGGADNAVSLAGYL